jgi:hypothetical protein
MVVARTPEGIHIILKSVEPVVTEPNAAPVCCAIWRWSIDAHLTHALGCIFEHHPLSEYDSIDLLWYIFLKCPGTYLGTCFEPSITENQNIDTTLVEYLSSLFRPLCFFPPHFGEDFANGLAANYILVTWHFEILCIVLVNPDPTLGLGFVDFIFLHVNSGDLHG